MPNAHALWQQQDTDKKNSTYHCSIMSEPDWITYFKIHDNQFVIYKKGTILMQRIAKLSLERETTRYHPEDIRTRIPAVSCAVVSTETLLVILSGRRFTHHLLDSSTHLLYMLPA